VRFRHTPTSVVAANLEADRLASLLLAQERAENIQALRRVSLGLGVNRARAKGFQFTNRGLDGQERGKDRTVDSPSRLERVRQSQDASALNAHATWHRLVSPERQVQGPECTGLKMSAVAARPSSDSVTREAAHGVPTITVDCGEEGERQSGRVPAVTKRGAIGRQPSSVNCPPSPSRRQNSSTRASGDESGARGDSTRASATARDVSGPAPTMTAVATTPTGTCASGYRPIRFGLTTIPASRSSPEVPWRRPRHEHIG